MLWGNQFFLGFGSLLSQTNEEVSNFLMELNNSVIKINIKIYFLLISFVFFHVLIVILIYW